MDSLQNSLERHLAYSSQVQSQNRIEVQAHPNKIISEMPELSNKLFLELKASQLKNSLSIEAFSYRLSLLLHQINNLNQKILTQNVLVFLNESLVCNPALVERKDDLDTNLNILNSKNIFCFKEAE